MTSRHAIIATCLTFALSACQRAATVEGRYTNGSSWLVFAPNGTVLIGETRDLVRFRVDGDSIRISDPMGSVAGRIVAPGVLTFEDQASNAIAVLFRGTWQSVTLTGRKNGSDAERERALGTLVGRWRLRGETNVMQVSPDGKYTWGKTEGDFEMLSADRVRMRTLEHGVVAGMLDCGLVMAEGQFTLVLPEASTMVFERMP